MTRFLFASLAWYTLWMGVVIPTLFHDPFAYWFNMRVSAICCLAGPVRWCVYEVMRCLPRLHYEPSDQADNPYASPGAR